MEFLSFYVILACVFSLCLRKKKERKSILCFYYYIDSTITRTRISISFAFGLKERKRFVLGEGNRKVNKKNKNKTIKGKRRRPFCFPFLVSIFFKTSDYVSFDQIWFLVSLSLREANIIAQCWKTRKEKDKKKSIRLASRPTVASCWDAGGISYLLVFGLPLSFLWAPTNDSGVC